MRATRSEARQIDPKADVSARRRFDHSAADERFDPAHDESRQEGSCFEGRHGREWKDLMLSH
jgi:hypothetical protein